MSYIEVVKGGAVLIKKQKSQRSSTVIQSHVLETYSKTFDPRFTGQVKVVLMVTWVHKAISNGLGY